MNHPLFYRISLTLFFALLACGFVLPARAADPRLPSSEQARLRRTPVVEVFEHCKDAVVNISSTQIIKVQSSPFGTDSLLEQLFELPGGGFPGMTREVKRTSVGSGFVIHHAGYVVTNAHVVSRTADQKVIFADKSEHDAQVIASDPELDLAVLKINAEHPLKTIKLGRSADLMVGETVIAVGNPLGYQNTVTAGVVSALDRTIQVNAQLSFKNLIQTDASINPGNSGGPLLNVLGELIGVNSAIRGDAQNIGFAIPVDQLRAALPELLDVERRNRIVTGVRISRDGAARIVAMEAHSPAAAAGLELGDTITRLDDNAVADGIDFSIALLGHKPGDALPVHYQRDGKPRTTALTLGARPKPDGAALLSQRFGIHAQPMTNKQARALGFRSAQALVVTAVDEGTPAAEIGLRPGDIIDSFAGYPASDLEEVGLVLEKVAAGRRVAISVLRIQGNTIFRTQTAIPAR